MPSKRYAIDTLLANAVQPFDDMDDEQFDALSADIPIEGPLPIPVSVSSDGILLDGHQRLKALQARGRRWVLADDVRVVQQATTDNAEEWAARLNLVRRKLTIKTGGEWALRMQAKHGWSQGKLAELAGVSQAAISQWVKAAKEAGAVVERPDKVVSKDGSVRPSMSAAAKKAAAKPKPDEDGEVIGTLGGIPMVLMPESKTKPVKRTPVKRTPAKSSATADVEVEPMYVHDLRAALNTLTVAVHHIPVGADGTIPADATDLLELIVDLASSTLPRA